MDLTQRAPVEGRASLGQAAGQGQGPQRRQPAPRLLGVRGQVDLGQVALLSAGLAKGEGPRGGEPRLERWRRVVPRDRAREVERQVVAGSAQPRAP